MCQPPSSTLPWVFLHPGELFSAAEPHLISTVLGSCVAVCLWDRRLRVGGMLHAVLPLWTAGRERSPRYADVAIATLTDGMRAHGCRVADLTAKIFGGAAVLPTPTPETSVGTKNVDAALRCLERHKIKVVAKRVLGCKGALIKQDTSTGSVWARHVASILPCARCTSAPGWTGCPMEKRHGLVGRETRV